MSLPKRLRVIGGTGSPYTQKMLALLRYRHIPFNIRWDHPDGPLDALGLEKPKPIFMPAVVFEDKNGGLKAECDSTPIIRHLESLYKGRLVLPTDPALAFIDYLLEDFGDEWCTKYMFHYRWHLREDAENAAGLLPLQSDVSLSEKEYEEKKRWIAERQIGRLHVVGSNETTAPVIDASYRRFLKAMENHLANQPFLLGNRPGAGDFSLYGQLTQLIGFDPTPRAIALEVSPRAVAWVDQLVDQSDIDPQEDDWLNLEDAPDSLRALLREIGRVYVPAQLANARAVKAGEKTWEALIDGVVWTQRAFPYQAKCLKWTNEIYQALSDTDRARVDVLLDGTGCDAMLHKA